MSGLALSLLGQFQAMLDGEPLGGLSNGQSTGLTDLPGREPATPQRRETLMTMLWPGMPERSARQNMRQIIYHLRRDIPDLPQKRAGGEQHRQPFPYCWPTAIPYS